MFVFPAFDENYKTRKRSFKCCQNCRNKRVKCEIASVNYESVGCSNCFKNNWNCDLISTERLDPNTMNTEELEKTYVSNFISNTNEMKSNSLIESLQQKCINSDENDDLDPKTITPQYLKDKFNFCITKSSQQLFSQYVFHVHPKAILNRKPGDEILRYESGVYIEDYKMKLRLTNPDSMKNHSIECGTDSTFYIKNSKTYKFLLSINAFYLATPEYPFTEDEIKELLDVYFFKINSLFPIINEKRFREDFKSNNTPTIIIYAIVLIILRDKLAEPILKNVFTRTKQGTGRYTDSKYIEFIVQFMTDLEQKVRQITLILPQLGDTDKLSKLIVLLLLSLHFSFDKLGNEQSSHDLTDAVNLALSLGFHMRRRDKRVDKEEIEYFTNLWWCCYVFDRFNALVNSKCTFITQENFNVDLPYNNINLLKIVQISRSLEHMLLSVLQPFNNSNVLNNNGFHKRFKLFNADEFQRYEFELCRAEKETKKVVYEFHCSLKESSLNAYVNDAIHFLTRLLNNTIILVSQKSKFDNDQIPNTIPEETSIEACQNILRYMLQMKEETVLNIPLVPWCLALAMAVLLKRKVKYLLKNINENSLQFEGQNQDENMYSWEDYISELDKFSSKWWVVEEICNSSKDFVQKLETSSTLRNKYISNLDDVRNKRLKVLLDSSNKVFPISFTPGNYDDASDTTASYMDENSGLVLAHDDTPSSNGNSAQPFENEGANSSFRPKTKNIDENHVAYTGLVSSHVPRHETDTTPLRCTSNNTFLDSMHIDLFDPEFLQDFPNIVNQFTEEY